MSIIDNVLRKITDENSTAATWKKLKDTYSKISLRSYFHLKKVVQSSCDEVASVNIYIYEFVSPIVVDLNKWKDQSWEWGSSFDCVLSFTIILWHFYCILQYKKDKIWLDDNKNALKSKELKNSFLERITENEVLVSKERTQHLEFSRKMFNARSKSREKSTIVVIEGSNVTIKVIVLS